MTTKNSIDIMMIGHFAKDKLVVDGQAEYASGGAVYYGSVALARQGIKVGVVTRLHPDDFFRLDDAKAEGVQIFAAPAEATSGIENIYNSANMERRICKLLEFAGPIQPEDIPDIPAKIYAITPVIAGEVDLALLKYLAGLGPVALDIQGFVRVPDGGDLVFKQWSDMEEGLKHVTYLKVDQAEAEMLTGQTDLPTAARQLAEYGPQEIVITQSAGVTVFVDGQIYTAPFTPRSLAGRTGRGDTCFSTYLARRLTASPQEAADVAAAVTTLKQEKPGPWRGTQADIEAVLARHAA
jgi:sugar/nucleoside kinase (ribokinase family)